MNKNIIERIGALLMILAFLPACAEKGEYYEDSGTIFKTIYHIKYKSPHSLSKEIQEELLRFDASMNPFNKESIIAKVNNNQPVEVDECFTTVFDKAMEVSANTNGVFDITCAPLINLWGFGFANSDQVTQTKIDSIKEFVGYRKIRLNGKKIEKDDPRVMLNCSAIAKGYASDVIGNLLERHGIENYMVEIGGEVKMKGHNPKGECWRIGVNKPIDDQSGSINEIEEVLAVCDGAVATSGNYRNFYVKNGKKYAHTIDPRTGYPSEQSLLSVTIVAANCMTADAYATAFMALGLDEAKKVAEKLNGEVEYLMIYAAPDGHHEIIKSLGIEKYIFKP
ncbi:MAG: FAD:protein FMN transferase [Bacteroidales bacterium]|nr:FAD:protein FMN transferase [Bacteroidales bacterium]